MSSLETLDDGLLEELKDIYSAERQLLQALPKMENKASNKKLKEAFRSHLEETEGQVDRLEKISAQLDEKLSGKTCAAMKGLIEEAGGILEQKSDNEGLIDALLIGAARRVEHYEMAAYQTARAMAVELGEEKIAKLLGESLLEETKADKLLSGIADREVLSNANAMREEDSKVGKMPRGSAKNGTHAGKATQLGAVIGFLIYSAALLPPLNAQAETHTEAQKNEAEAFEHEADSSGRNARDANDYRKTADDQSFSGDETELLGQIRREIVANDTLSVNGKNVKIIIESGTVTLRGPVQSNDERNWIEEVTARAAPGYKVTNQIEIVTR